MRTRQDGSQRNEAAARRQAARDVVVEGEVDVSRRQDDGSDALLATLGPGDHFGEMALLEGRETHSASVRAKTAVNVLTLGRDDFMLLANKWEGLNDTLAEVVKARQ